MSQHIDLRTAQIEKDGKDCDESLIGSEMLRDTPFKEKLRCFTACKAYANAGRKIVKKRYRGYFASCCDRDKTNSLLIVSPVIEESYPCCKCEPRGHGQGTVNPALQGRCLL
jgi:hypothetical protein